MSLISTAWAMGAGQPVGGDANIFASLMPFALIFLVFYFMLIRPQQRKAKEHKEMLAGLKKGDAVITAGGMYGRIIEVDGDIMVVDLGETRVTMGRGFLAPAPVKRQAPAAAPAKKEKKGGRKLFGGKEKSVEETAPTPEAAPVAEAAPAAAIAPAAEEASAAAEAVPGEASPAAEPPVVPGDDKDKPAGL